MSKHSLERQFSRFALSDRKPCLEMHSVIPADEITDAQSTSRFHEYTCEEVHDRLVDTRIVSCITSKISLKHCNSLLALKSKKMY